MLGPGGPILALLLAAAQPCDQATDAILRELARQAVEQSFKGYVEHLFQTWMREETPDQQARVQRGMEKAIRAYLYSRRAIEKWPGTCR